ncbi:MAG: hypothetical protein JNK72_18910 [Myxococcales bacterium]|nr:hypothetical protein [Myxococcales bacterium]
MNKRIVTSGLLAMAMVPVMAQLLSGCVQSQPQPTTQAPPPPPPQPVVQSAPPPPPPQPTGPAVVQGTAMATGNGGAGSMVSPTWTATGYNGADWVSANMTTRARQFANGFVAVTDLVRGLMNERERRTVAATVVAGHCYRIIGVGGAGVRDLDLYLRDMSGRVIDQDRAPDNYPVIGLDRQLCIPAGMGNQPAQLEIVMFSGRGEVGVQVFGSP